MPVYNSHPGYFRQAIEALLGQTYGDFEIMLSDNASGPEARALYEEYARRDPRVHYSRLERNMGAVYNFNHVLKLGSGEYFKWAADDDNHAPTFLEETVTLLDKNRDAVTGSSEMCFIDEEDRRFLGCTFSPLVASRSVAVRTAAMSAKHVYMDVYALHRRKALARVREQQTVFCADYVFVFELLLQGRILRAPGELFAHRMYKRSSEFSAQRLVAEGAPPVARRGIWRALVRGLTTGVLSSQLSAPQKAASLGVLGGVLLQRGRRW
jgi:glycosyltransferase involved in cell wall biosynthesis